MRALIIALALAAGCDSRATASDPAGKAELKSHEFETCGASAQCQDDLRCFDHTCRRTNRSTVGDYYAALGGLSRAHGDLEAAIGAYAQALGHYDAEKLALPPEIDCAYGATLAAAKTKKEHAELGARVLHRCVLAVPVGSRLREQALGELAGLADVGLDPLALAKPQLTDVYLTKGAAKPAADKLTVTITNPGVPAKSSSAIADKLGEPEQHSALVACWQAYTDAAKKDTLAVTIGVKSTYIASEYEDESGVFVLKLDPAAGLAGPEAAADTCVRAIVEPALKSVVKEGFATKLSVTIK